MGRRKLIDGDRTWLESQTVALAHSIETRSARVNEVLAQLGPSDRGYIKSVGEPSGALLRRLNREDQLLLRSLHRDTATLNRKLSVLDLVDLLLDRHGPSKEKLLDKAQRNRWWNCSSGRTRWSYATMRRIADRAKKYLAWNDPQFWFLFDPVYLSHWPDTSFETYEMVSAWCDQDALGKVEEFLAQLRLKSAELAQLGVNVDQITAVVRAEVLRQDPPVPKIFFGPIGVGHRVTDLTELTAERMHSPLRERARHPKQTASRSKAQVVLKRAR